MYFALSSQNMGKISVYCCCHTYCFLPCLPSVPYINYTFSLCSGLLLSHLSWLSPSLPFVDWGYAAYSFTAIWFCIKVIYLRLFL